MWKIIVLIELEDTKAEGRKSQTFRLVKSREDDSVQKNKIEDNRNGSDHVTPTGIARPKRSCMGTAW